MANLITLEEYKAFKKISNPSEDERLDYLIASVSQLVKTYCGNSIIDYYSTNKEETFSISWETNFIQLTESPLIRISSIEEMVTPGKYTDLNDDEYFIDYNLDAIFRVHADSGAYKDWKRGAGSVRVSYTAGYESCPEDLKLAVVDLITYYHKEEHKERRTLAGATVQNPASTSVRDSVAFPDHIKRILDLYKNF